MTPPVPSPQCSQISLSYHYPGSHGCFRAVHSTHMLLLGRGHLWKLPMGPTAEPLHTVFFISWLHSGNQGQFPLALGPTGLCCQPIPCSHAGKSIFPHLVNLVILPAPKDPLSPLEAGWSIGYFSFVLWCISTWSNILKHLFEQKRERKKRQVDIIKCILHISDWGFNVMLWGSWYAFVLWEVLGISSREFHEWLPAQSDA